MWVPNLPMTLISAVAASAGALAIIKDFYGGAPYDQTVKADNKTVIITGANTGIGRETALEFAKRGAKVFMACRNMEKCEEARREIVLETQNKFVYCRPCDLSSTKSIRKFVERFKQEEPHVHILVNNAAVMEPAEKITLDGFEPSLGVNHLGHFLLTNLLLDTIKASAPSRIIIVTDSAHRRGTIHRDDLNMSSSKDKNKMYAQSKLANVLFARELGRRLLGDMAGKRNVIHRDDLNMSSSKDKNKMYAQSKLANVLFARELGRRLLDKNVSVVAVDPGFTDTTLTKNLPMMKSITRFLIYPIFWPVMKTPRIASQTILHAALDSKMGKCSGDYYKDMTLTEPSKEAQDYELAQWLWKVSEKWTKLHEHQQTIKASAA